MEYSKFWKASFLRMREAVQANRENFLAVRYEELVEDPRRVMSKTAEFLGIAYDKCLMRPTFMNQPWCANSSFKVNKEFESKIFTESLERWKQLLGWHERVLIESGVADELLELGYAQRIRFQGLRKYIWRTIQQLTKVFP